MKPDEIARLKKQGPPSAATPPNFRDIPLVPPGRSTPNPAFCGRVNVTRGQSGQEDYNATLAILDYYRKGDDFNCPRCAFTTQSVDAFVEHITDEMNTAMAGHGARPEPVNQP